MAQIEKLLIQQQTDDLIRLVSSGQTILRPPSGWIQAVRLSLGMSLRQLASRLGIAANTVKNFEKREQLEAITIGSLKKVANSMDMELVYYFRPRSGSISKMIELQARKKAEVIVRRSSQTMTLENQETSQESQERELERIVKELVQKMPGILWD